MKRNKNFYRYELLKLAELHGDSPFVFTGIYKHADKSDWVTLTTLKLLGQNHSKAICSHINLPRQEVENYLVLSQSSHGKKVCFLGRIKSYQYYGSTRGGISLQPLDANYSAIWLAKQSAEENRAYEVQLKEVWQS